MWTDHFWLVRVLWKDACSVFSPETNSGVASSGKTAIFVAQQHSSPSLTVISRELLTLDFKVCALFFTSQDDDIAHYSDRADILIYVFLFKKSCGIQPHLLGKHGRMRFLIFRECHNINSLSFNSQCKFTYKVSDKHICALPKNTLVILCRNIKAQRKCSVFILNAFESCGILWQKKKDIGCR